MRDSPIGRAAEEYLAWLESHEYADWDACGSIARAGRLDEDKLLGCYAEAVVWAESALHLF